MRARRRSAAGARTATPSNGLCARADGSPWRTARTCCSLNLVAAPESYGGYSAEPVAREHVSLLSVLRRRALIIIVVALLTGGAAAAFAVTRGDTYEST